MNNVAEGTEKSFYFLCGQLSQRYAQYEEDTDTYSVYWNDTWMCEYSSDRVERFIETGYWRVINFDDFYMKTGKSSDSIFHVIKANEDVYILSLVDNPVSLIFSSIKDILESVVNADFQVVEIDN